MRLCSILCLLLFASCGKSNDIGANQTVSALENREYLTIPHQDVSLLRNKLLNKVIESSIPILNPNGEIKNRDELNEYKMDSRDLADYELKEKSMAKIIVSFPDKTEIYFVSERILVASLTSSLGLFEKEGRVFRWVMNDTPRTYAGGTFYLLSLKNEDLVKNDQDFFKKEYLLKDNFVGKLIPFSSKKNVEVTVDYEFYQPKIETEVVSGSYCTSTCFICSYKIDKVTDVYEKVASVPASELGFSMRKNGKILSYTDLELRNSTEGQFTMRAKREETSKQDSNVEVIQMAPSVNLKEFQGSEYSNASCPKVVRKSEVQNKINFQVTVKILGRGEDIRKIVL